MQDLYKSRWHEKYFRSERIEMLTDGVFAIVLTLLVLDLHIPKLVHEESSAELWAETRKMFPHFRSFLITFLWIANSWSSGQSFMRLVVKIDSVVVWILLFMLLVICLFPFPTALMGEYPYNPLGVVYFGILTIIFGGLVICLTQYTVRKKYITPHVDLDYMRNKIKMIPILMPVYFIPLAVAFWSPVVAQVIYFCLGVQWIFSTSSWKLQETG